MIGLIKVLYRRDENFFFVLFWTNNLYKKVIVKFVMLWTRRVCLFRLLKKGYCIDFYVFTSILYRDNEKCTDKWENMNFEIINRNFLWPRVFEMYFFLNFTWLHVLTQFLKFDPIRQNIFQFGLNSE